MPADLPPLSPPTRDLLVALASRPEVEELHVRRAPEYVVAIWRDGKATWFEGPALLVCLQHALADCRNGGR